MRKRGFTLIEITIALLVMAIGLTGILTLFPVAIDASGRSARITEATFLAQALLEDIKRCGHDIFTAAGSGYTGTGGATGPWTLSGSFIGLTNFAEHPNYEYDIFAYSNTTIGVSSSVNLREVVVRVYWPAGSGDPGLRDGQRFVELSTYLADYTP